MAYFPLNGSIVKTLIEKQIEHYPLGRLSVKEIKKYVAKNISGGKDH